MRLLAILPLALFTAGCLAPGERDPTRYPWDPRNRVGLSAAPHPRIVARGAIAPDPGWQPQPQAVPPQESYCIMAIEQESRSGISIGGNVGVMACSAPANPPQPR